jgi:GT2 family glycosyltransferase
MIHRMVHNPAPQRMRISYDVVVPGAVPLTIAIPTYERGAVLCDTIEYLLALDPRADEILIVDQTRRHPPEVAARLEAWERTNAIRMIRLDAPSIPRAMNVALRDASHERVLFLDDDIIPSPRLVAAHMAAFEHTDVWAVVGQVLQPGESPAHFEEAELRRGFVRDLDFRFSHDTACDVQNVMAGNLCVDRAHALEIGGFDERYTAVAYRFETDFALRLVAAGGRIRYEPAASIHHLKVPGGGVRMWGDHRTSASPAHSMGDYTFARRHVPSFWRYVARRLRNNVLTRFHLRHPWTIPGKLIGELRGLVRALRLDQ